MRARTEVFETINRWIHDGGGAQDALDDAQLYASIISFLDSTTEHCPPSELADDSQVQRAFTTINENRKAVLQSFTHQTMRPLASNISTSELFPQSSQSSQPPSFGSDPPDIDTITAEELVSNFDAMAAAAFQNVTQEVCRAVL
jgi:GTPase-activating protein BEM2